MRREAALPPPALPMVRPGPRGPGRPGGRYHCRAGGVSALARSVLRALCWARQACSSPCPPGRPRARLRPPSPHQLRNTARKGREWARPPLIKAWAVPPRGGGGLYHCSTGGGAPRLPFPPVWGGREHGDRSNPKIAPQKTKSNLGLGTLRGRAMRQPRCVPSGRAQPQEHRPCPRFCIFQENWRGRSDFRPLLFRTEQLFLNKSSILFTLCHPELKRGVFWFPFPW